MSQTLPKNVNSVGKSNNFAQYGVLSPISLFHCHFLCLYHSTIALYIAQASTITWFVFEYLFMCFPIPILPVICSKSNFKYLQNPTKH